MAYAFSFPYFIHKQRWENTICNKINSILTFMLIIQILFTRKLCTLLFENRNKISTENDLVSHVYCLIMLSLLFCVSLPLILFHSNVMYKIVNSTYFPFTFQFIKKKSIVHITFSSCLHSKESLNWNHKQNPRNT